MKCPAAATESITNAGRVRASSCTSATPTSPSWCAPPTIRRTGHRICERCGASSSGSRALAMARYALRVASRLRPAAAVYPTTVESVTQLGSPEESMSIPRILRRMSRIPQDPGDAHRSEEHTSELQSLAYLVCRLLLEKKKLNRSKQKQSAGSGWN